MVELRSQIFFCGWLPYGAKDKHILRYIQWTFWNMNQTNHYPEVDGSSHSASNSRPLQINLIHTAALPSSPSWDRVTRYTPHVTKLASSALVTDQGTCPCVPCGAASLKKDEPVVRLLLTFRANGSPFLWNWPCTICALTTGSWGRVSLHSLTMRVLLLRNMICESVGDLPSLRETIASVCTTFNLYWWEPSICV